MTPPDNLPDDLKGLIELAEWIADGLETGTIVLLTNAEAAFMDQVQRGGLSVPRQSPRLVAMADRLAAAGLVTVDRAAADHIVVSALRPGEGDDAQG